MQRSSLLKRACLESLPHLDVVEALLIEQAELLHAPPHKLHCERSAIDWCVGVQGWNNLHGKHYATCKCRPTHLIVHVAYSKSLTEALTLCL